MILDDCASKPDSAVARFPEMLWLPSRCVLVSLTGWGCRNHNGRCHDAGWTGCMHDFSHN